MHMFVPVSDGAGDGQETPPRLNASRVGRYAVDLGVAASGKRFYSGIG